MILVTENAFTLVNNINFRAVGTRNLGRGVLRRIISRTVAQT